MNKQQKIALIKNTCQEILASVGYEGRYDFDLGCEAPTPCCIWTDMIPEEVWGMAVMKGYQHFRDTDVIFGIPDWFVEDERLTPEMIKWVYAHECGHAFLGHFGKAEGTPDFIRQEKEADAFASVHFPDVVPEEVLAIIVLREFEEKAMKGGYTLRLGVFTEIRIKNNCKSINGDRLDIDLLGTYMQIHLREAVAV